MEESVTIFWVLAGCAAFAVIAFFVFVIIYVCQSEKETRESGKYYDDEENEYIM